MAGARCRLELWPLASHKLRGKGRPPPLSCESLTLQPRRCRPRPGGQRVPHLRTAGGPAIAGRAPLGFRVARARPGLCPLPGSVQLAVFEEPGSLLPDLTL